MSKLSSRRHRKPQREHASLRWRRRWIAVGIVIAVGLAIAIGSYGFYTYQRSRIPVIQITPESQNLGRISPRMGIISTLFTVENAGNGDLIIEDMETSCGCTTVALIVDEVEGPSFGMKGHGPSPDDWSARLAPGEQAQLKVYYDPNFHPGLSGWVTRGIVLRSNDPDTPMKIVTFEVLQVG